MASNFTKFHAWHSCTNQIWCQPSVCHHYCQTVIPRDFHHFAFIQVWTAIFIPQVNEISLSRDCSRTQKICEVAKSHNWRSTCCVLIKFMYESDLVPTKCLSSLLSDGNSKRFSSFSHSYKYGLLFSYLRLTKYRQVWNSSRTEKNLRGGKESQSALYLLCADSICIRIRSGANQVFVITIVRR